MDTYQQELIDAIRQASNGPVVGDVIETAIDNLIQKKINPHLIVCFIAKMQNRIYNTDWSVSNASDSIHFKHAIEKLAEIKDRLHYGSDETTFLPKNH